MELRYLETFVVVAEELHFGRAADRLNMSASMVSEAIARLEAELGTRLFVRSTRRVELTAAGAELSRRADAILREVSDARRSVRDIANGNAGTVRLGVTPPAALVLTPHLRSAVARDAPDIVVETHRFWLPDLGPALADRRIDVAITCRPLTGVRGDVVTRGLAADRLFVGVRPEHRLATCAAIDLRDLADERLGLHPARLFPAWSSTQRDVLEAYGVRPPVVELADTDLVAGRWASQHDVDWIFLTSSLAASHTATVVKPLDPERYVPFTMSWVAARAHHATLARFLRASLRAARPEGWLEVRE